MPKWGSQLACNSHLGGDAALPSFCHLARHRYPMSNKICQVKRCSADLAIAQPVNLSLTACCACLHRSTLGRSQPKFGPRCHPNCRPQVANCANKHTNYPSVRCYPGKGVYTREMALRSVALIAVLALLSTSVRATTYTPSPVKTAIEQSVQEAVASEWGGRGAHLRNARLGR